MTDPKIFYQPSKLRWDVRLTDHPLSTYTPLNDAAAAAAQTDATVGDLTPNDHVVVYFSSRHFIPYWGTKCNISLMMLEPQGIKPRHYFTLPFFFWNFKHILTHSTKILKRCPNAVFFNPHVCTTPPGDVEKTKGISLIASKKRDLFGHRLRHVVADACRDKLDLYGRAYKPVRSKSDALLDYRFSVAIENSRYGGYFTEKILDCFINKTVPIYWGDPEIGRHFDAAGIIVCDTKEELIHAINTVTEEDYESRRAAIENNFAAALKYTDFKTMLSEMMISLAAADGKA